MLEIEAVKLEVFELELADGEPESEKNEVEGACGVGEVAAAAAAAVFSLKSSRVVFELAPACAC